MLIIFRGYGSEMRFFSSSPRTLEAPKNANFYRIAKHFGQNNLGLLLRFKRWNAQNHTHTEMNEEKVNLDEDICDVWFSLIMWVSQMGILLFSCRN